MEGKVKTAKKRTRREKEEETGREKMGEMEEGSRERIRSG